MNTPHAYDYFILLLISANIYLFTNWKWGLGSFTLMVIFKMFFNGDKNV